MIPSAPTISGYQFSALWTSEISSDGGSASFLAKDETYHVLDRIRRFRFWVGTSL
jgi:hypothetical protein